MRPPCNCNPEQSLVQVEPNVWVNEIRHDEWCALLRYINRQY